MPMPVLAQLLVLRAEVLVVAMALDAQEVQEVLRLKKQNPTRTKVET
jgi:hypothetical protein